MKKNHRLSKLKFAHNPMIIVILGFLLIILIGAFLLMLPFSHRNGEWYPFFSALFTSVSATCVNGFTFSDLHSTFSLFGEIMILLLIQIGGLGFMSFASVLMIGLKKSISFGERMVLSNSLGLSTAGGIIPYVRMVVGGTFLIEGIGALLLSFHFIPKLGFFSGLWQSVFLSISAFCNAGFDILGLGNSVASIKTDPLPLIILMLLAILGGLGFWVWKELMDLRKKIRLSLYSKLVLITSGILILFGAAFYILAEWNNPATLGGLHTGDKITNAFFTSVTMRTVGFSTFDISNLTESSKLISGFLMLIGGASGSTAGGIKVITFAVIVITAYRVACGRTKIHLWRENLEQNDIFRAFSLFFIGIGIVFFSTMITCFLNPEGSLTDLFLNCASAFSTTGIAAFPLTSMTTLSLILLMLLMFIGRVGILSITIAIMVRLNQSKDRLSYPDANILIG